MVYLHPNQEASDEKRNKQKHAKANEQLENAHSSGGNERKEDAGQPSAESETNAPGVTSATTASNYDQNAENMNRSGLELL